MDPDPGENYETIALLWRIGGVAFLFWCLLVASRKIGSRRSANAERAPLIELDAHRGDATEQPRQSRTNSDSYH